MLNIFYKDGVIIFEGHVTSFIFYSQFFEALREHYKVNGRKTQPKISFINVSRFDPKVIVNIIGIGILLSKFHLKPTDLLITNTTVIGYLKHTGFFDIVGKQKEKSEKVVISGHEFYNSYTTGIDIFNFDEGFFGFYNQQQTKKEYRREHKIHYYPNQSYDYYKIYNEDITSEEKEIKLENIRNSVFEDYTLKKIPKDFARVLSDYIQDAFFSDKLVKIFGEIVTNSVVYSFSSCIAILQTDEFKTTISISDFGVGLEGSVKYKTSFERVVTNKFKGTQIDKPQFEAFLLIMDCLHYSKKNNRENLWQLKQTTLELGGVFRLHYNNTQIIFTSNRCYNCEKDIIDCTNCLIKNINTELVISPLKIFRDKLSGVHIEIEIPNPNKINK